MAKTKSYWARFIWKCLRCHQQVYVFDVLLVLVSLPASMSLVQLHFSYRNSRALCAIKEVEIFPDDKKSAASIKQLWQVILQNFCTTIIIYIVIKHIKHLSWFIEGNLIVSIKVHGLNCLDL